MVVVQPDAWVEDAGGQGEITLLPIAPRMTHVSDCALV